MAQSSKKGKKKSEVSIIKKGFDDLTTRNNYYFNAKLIYDEMVKNHLLTRQLNYHDTLPYYFHDDGTDFSTQGKALHDIIVKTGITLQRHDYARWKDDCYHLMGIAFFLKGNLDTALLTFQYVTTTMRGQHNNKKVAVSQKEILKAKIAKKKELDRLAETKKKQMERQAKEKEAALAKTIADKQKRMDVAAKQREQELKKKIKEKEKMLKQKAKGKYKPPAATAKKPTAPAGTTPGKPSAKSKGDRKKPGEILDKVMSGVSIEMKQEGSLGAAHKAVGDYRSLEAQKKASEIGNVEDSLTQKQIEKLDQLTFWEKIKHHPKRAQSIVWMTKTLIAQGDYYDAESMLAYSQTLKKLRRTDKKEIGIVRSYFYYQKGYHDKAADELSATLPHIKKKKELSYFSYLHAQLSERANPQSAYDAFKQVRKINKDEKLDFFALEQMRRLLKTGKVSEPDPELLPKAYAKASKSRTFGDQAFFALADMAASKGDTARSIEMLRKSIAFLGGTKEQKSLSWLQLGEIYYQKAEYSESFACFDSARAGLPADFAAKEYFENKHARLKEIVEQSQLAFRQDSLLALSVLSREELAAYIRDKNRVEQKENRKARLKAGEDASFSSEGLGSNANFDMSQTQYTSKTGQWYFYNNDLRARGANDFKLLWGDRPYVNNWRRIEATKLTTAQKKAADEEAQEKLAAKTPAEEERPIYKIPETPEEKAASHAVIEKSLLQRGKIFFQGLTDHKPALDMLGEQLQKYPKGEKAAEGLYYKMLIYADLNMDAQARKSADQLVAEFPESEWAKKLGQPKTPTEKIASEGTNDAEKLYVSLYNHFTEGSYNEVIKGRKYFLEKYAEQKALLPKVSFLEAMSFAKMGELDLYKRALNDIIVNYPKSPESAQAKLYLSSYQQYERMQKEGVETNEHLEDKNKEDFTYEDGYHFLMILVREKKYSNAALNQGLNAIMETLFPGQRIKATNSFLDAATPMLLVKRFNNIADATFAANSVMSSEDPLFIELAKISDVLLISQENFKELFTSKKLKEYKDFHSKYYNFK